MAISYRKEEILKEFISSTPKRISKSGAGRESDLTDELLSQIEINMQTGIMQKYVYNGMGIIKGTWDGWKQKGNKLIDQIRSQEISLQQTTEQEKRYIYFSFIILTAKSKAITGEWQNMKRLAKGGSYKASEFILRIMGGKDFTVTDQLQISPGVGDRTDKDEQIERELDSFRPVGSIEQLEESAHKEEEPEIVQELNDGDIEI